MDDGEYLSIGKTLDELDGFKLRYEEWNQHFGILKREIRYYKVYTFYRAVNKVEFSFLVHFDTFLARSVGRVFLERMRGD